MQPESNEKVQDAGNDDRMTRMLLEWQHQQEIEKVRRAEIRAIFELECG
jgi:hypothetical protein